jgi:hypothetical protein
MHDIEKHPYGFKFTLESVINRICNYGMARWVATAFGAVVLPVILHAQPSAHYVPGTEGLEGSSLPPPGNYLRDYSVAYTADRINNASGHEINGIGANAFIFANVPRLIWITNTKVLDGNIGFDLVMPIEYTSVRVKAADFDSSTWGLGDAFTEITLSWHSPHLDTAVGYGVWVPTGTSAAGLNTKAGAGFWTNMFTAGATWSFDTDRTWTLSLLNRYEISSKDRDMDLTPGDTYTLEWGLGYAPSKIMTVGLVGYYQTEVNLATGAAANPDRSSVVGVGPEVSGSIPGAKLLWSLRYVDAKSRFQGNTIVLTLTKIF